jgi:hypothetical protein
MKIHLKHIIVFLLMLDSIDSIAQIWPFSPMIRFGNTVYYPVDSLKTRNLTGTSLMAFDKQLITRYFDIISKEDSIGFLFNDSLVYFKQKIRNEPKCYKEILFYNRRSLSNANVKIKYLKILDINDINIVAQLTLRQKNGSKKYNRKETVLIDKEDIVGVFLGAGRNERIFVSVLSSFATIIIILINTN